MRGRPPRFRVDFILTAAGLTIRRREETVWCVLGLVAASALSVLEVPQPCCCHGCTGAGSASLTSPIWNTRESDRTRERIITCAGGAYVRVRRAAGRILILRSFREPERQIL